MQHNGDINQTDWRYKSKQIGVSLTNPTFKQVNKPSELQFFFILKMFITQGCCEDLWTWVNMPQSVCHTVDPL